MRAGLCCVLGVLVVACVERATAPARATAYIGFQIGPAPTAAAAVDVNVTYRRESGTNLPLSSTRFALAASQQDAVVTINLTICLDDRDHAGGRTECKGDLTIALLDTAGAELDRQVLGPLSLRAGAVTRIPALTLSATPSALVHVNARANDLLSPAQITLEAGTYDVSVRGTAQGGLYDAWLPWSGVSCGQSGGCPQTAPTTVTGWKNSYDAISPDIVSVVVDGVELTPVSDAPTGTAVFRDHFLSSPTVTRYHVDDLIVYPTALAALNAARGSTFTLGRASTVGFGIADIRPLFDNRGGVSLRIDRRQ